ncbi:PREDICTED: uncharacterized protein LOC106332905 [Brassica oleracea var. oleracea]|uniref:uncharacterized protein LOC106332905 n=1 Tax=Brassica oleracea var. oleracea TaxID=109376 RepID=UPI0006A6F610|nr:PREDICTED: uncharacterized protein LOC106332905 [Brassica oleracea var. oleracea]
MMEALKNFRINNKVMSTLECMLWLMRSFRFQGMLSQRNLQNVRGSEVSQWKKSGLLFGFLFIHCLPARGQDKIHYEYQTILVYLYIFGSWSLKPDNLLKWEPSTPEILCGSRVCAEVKGVQYKTSHIPIAAEVINNTAL